MLDYEAGAVHHEIIDAGDCDAASQGRIGAGAI